MKKRVIALALCLVMLLTGLGMSEVAFNLFANPLSISCDGNTVDSVTLPQNEKRLLTAVKDEEVLTDCQWQIQVSEDVWVDIAGANTPTLELSYAMVANLLNNDIVNLRFRTSADDGDAFSDAVKVMVEREAAVGIKMMMSAANEAAAADDEPGTAYYTVKHYQQNVDNDEYTLIDTETKSGIIGDEVGAKHQKTYNGFYALPYNESATINADGTTVVEIKYDRFYYLMSFDLDGGYGVEPVYAKFGATIEAIDDPKKSGYAFAGWQLNGNEVKLLPKNMPSENQTYTAKWTEAITKFTVAYWLQNADDDGYSVFATKTVDSISGKEVQGSTYKNDYQGTSENLTDVLRHITFNEDKTDKNVTIAGDGSTVVNVYYDREKYTLKFYYAMSGVSGGKEEFYVVGGSTYPFGGEAGIADKDKDDALKLIDQYMGNNAQSANRGTVDNKPDLNDEGKKRKYNEGLDESTVNGVQYKYYYISFTAKYGADISELWPCDVFNSVTRTSGGYNEYGENNNKTKWKSKEAFVSAWNGEHHVKYSQTNDNQTIKGKYSQLDENLLWNESAFHSYADDYNTVDFLCFWENGANVNWSIPELYRYNIWVPLLEEQASDYLITKEKGGITYYLRDRYDTVDDSNPENQTQPSIKGFSTNGWDHSDIKDYNKELYREAYDVNFYYKRNMYNLTFMNYGTEYKSRYVSFEADISCYSDTMPSYPSELEKDAYVFEGWYTTSVFAEGTKFDFKDKQMPANDMVLYAHWVPVTHTVKFYLDKEKLDSGSQLVNPKSATHNTKIENVKDPQNGGYKFVGWFYMDGDTEKAFDFVNMPVVKDMDVYGKWTSDKIVKYTVYYKLKGTDIDVAEKIEGAAPAGWGVTVVPKTGDELYEKYRNNCTPLSTNSHYLSLNTDGENTYFFYYELNLADLTITKKGCQNIDENQSFIFNVVGVDDNTKGIEMKVVIQGDGSVTIKDLPVGKYTVTEKTDWSWRYAPDYEAMKSINLNGVGPYNVEFENKRADISNELGLIWKWLNGCAYNENSFDNKN